MKIINLIEDTHGNNACIAEHGLSFCIETEGHRILVDTGASDAFIKNAEKLGVDLTTVDTVILSHGHYDHTGGVLGFNNINSDANIYMQSEAMKDYYNTNGDAPRYIGVDKKISLLPNLHLIEGNMRIDRELFLFTDISCETPVPSSNKTLKRKENNEFLQDDFSHEQCVVITVNGKYYLLCGCAHNGILNIMREYNKLFGNYPDYVISGFHMMKNGVYSDEDISLIKETGEALLKTGSVFHTCHCTTEYPYKIMKEIMGDKLHWISSGDRVL